MHMTNHISFWITKCLHFEEHIPWILWSAHSLVDAPTSGESSCIARSWFESFSIGTIWVRYRVIQVVIQLSSRTTSTKSSLCRLRWHTCCAVHESEASIILSSGNKMWENPRIWKALSFSTDSSSSTCVLRVVMDVTIRRWVMSSLYNRSLQTLSISCERDFIARVIVLRELSVFVHCINLCILNAWIHDSFLCTLSYCCLRLSALYIFKMVR